MYLPTPTSIFNDAWGIIARFGDYYDRNDSTMPYVLTVFRADGSFRHSFLNLPGGDNVELFGSWSNQAGWPQVLCGQRLSATVAVVQVNHQKPFGIGRVAEWARPMKLPLVSGIYASYRLTNQYAPKILRFSHFRKTFTHPKIHTKKGSLPVNRQRPKKIPAPILNRHRDSV